MRPARLCLCPCAWGPGRLLGCGPWAGFLLSGWGDKTAPTGGSHGTTRHRWPPVGSGSGSDAAVLGSAGGGWGGGQGAQLSLGGSGLQWLQGRRREREGHPASSEAPAAGGRPQAAAVSQVAEDKLAPGPAGSVWDVVDAVLRGPRAGQDSGPAEARGACTARGLPVGAGHLSTPGPGAVGAAQPTRLAGPPACSPSAHRRPRGCAGSRSHPRRWGNLAGRAAAPHWGRGQLGRTCGSHAHVCLVPSSCRVARAQPPLASSALPAYPATRLWL